MESIYLMGSEDVSRAASTIRSAAEQMTLAGSNMSFVFEQHQRFMTDWLEQFQTALREVRNVPD